MRVSSTPEGLKSLFEVGVPLIYVVSTSEDRIQRVLYTLCKTVLRPPRAFYSFDCVTGIRGEGTLVEGTSSLPRALDWISKQKGEICFFLKDVTYFWDNDPIIQRRIKNLVAHLKSQNSLMVFVGRTGSIPVDLRGSIFVVDQELPSRDELNNLIMQILSGDKMAEPLIKADPRFQEKVLRASLGLNLDEAERAIRKALSSGCKVVSDIISYLLEEKRQIVKQSGMLEFVDNDTGIHGVGGMGTIKEWLLKRARAYSTEATSSQISRPKGVLLMGISGCGKSLFVKAIAGFWDIPLLRLDMAAVYEGTFGSAEESLRKAIRTAEAVAPCVLWIDEMEAGISVQGQKAEGGSSSRVLGYFLTWMQEKKDPVFVAATANQIELLPAEVLRKGRFDEIFYISLPGEEDRLQIFTIHLSRRGYDPEKFDVKLLAHSTKGFSGAEIEQAVVSAIFESVSSERELTDEDLSKAVSRTVPLSVTMAEQIKKIESWAFKRAVPAGERQKSIV